MTSCVRQLCALCGGQLGECAVKSADSPPQLPRELGSERMQLCSSYTHRKLYVTSQKRFLGSTKSLKHCKLSLRPHITRTKHCTSLMRSTNTFDKISMNEQHLNMAVAVSCNPAPTWQTGKTPRTSVQSWSYSLRHVGYLCSESELSWG